MEQSFYSNGKLLIMGEYTVLDGAPALAVPTKYGQHLYISEGHEHSIKWVSKDADGTTWLEAHIPFSDIISKAVQPDKPEYTTLVAILHEAHKANPDVLNSSRGFVVTTGLTFPRQWGLGTSSTLINNIAQWFAIDAFLLLAGSFGGSGYDIACAQNNTPILYQLKDGQPVVEHTDFNPAFKDKLYFVYLNRKQNSRSAIASYKEKRHNIAPTLAAVDALITRVLHTEDLAAFRSALEEHEQVLSKILGIPTIKEAVFPDFTGTIKSLGAWGGDFVLAAADDDPTVYFKQHGYDVVIPYNEMILE